MSAKLTYEITGGNEELLQIAKSHKNDIVLIDFTATWCGPCKFVAPKLHALVDTYQKSKRRLVLCKVDVDLETNKDACSSYKIESMPTLVWIDNGTIVGRVEGANSNAIIAKTKEVIE